HKVFWSILLSAAGVLLAILIAFNILRQVQTASKMESILDSAFMMLKQENEMEKRHGGIREGGKDKSEMLRSVSEGELGAILLDSEGSIIKASGCAEQLDEETLSTIAKAAISDADGHGRTKDWEYKTIISSGGTSISFLNAASLRKENIETMLLSLAAFSAACLLFALMARFLSRAIVKPVEENMQMQKRFVADASHELKTPLAVIDANASVLEQTVGPNKWLNYIKEQTARMSALVNELLQLSNLEEAGNSDSKQQHEQFDAAEAVMTAALPFESVAFERGVTLETDTPDTLNVQGCSQDLEQLAAILIDNAIKHSKPGGTVKVALGTSTARRGWKEEPVMELCVSNTGDEIPPDALPHIFDRFYRLDQSRTHKDNSYGLGLAIAKRLAEKNGGSIAASSENGVTEFRFLFADQTNRPL
ncbi:MAG: HAMP domain-containing sensor histidine kinase, partial [Lachnospiraceae bacterium]|nr:HAMP domain-containing sensor histidine kinase [Lachnospiraceae bacterium]